MSPRRSSRARTTQLPPSVVPAAPSISSSSHTSSASSARTERAMRAINHKQSSPQKSTTPHSLSSEDPQAEPPLTRRRTREQDPDDGDSPKMEDALEDEDEEQEVTRCVCTFLEYPGPPAIITKSKEGPPSSLADSDVQNEEGGLFIQCDTCHVWQHGQCVGIMDEASTPDEYFCEHCRKDLHKLLTDSKGQKYSRYLPVYEQIHGKNTRKPSMSKESETRSIRDKDRMSRASVESFGKRRSTMNSRAAYDEDEVLRKVLEESKKEGAATVSESGTRKRSRDDSEEIKTEVKRQRTNSRSPSNTPILESEDDALKSAATKQKPRGAAARSQREKELREKEKERERAEAANRRKGRAERRKAEELEAAAEAIQAVEETPMAPSVSESVPPDTPTADLKPPPAPRKSGRPPQKRGRLGRNQHSRDPPTPAGNGASPTSNGEIPKSPQISATNTNGVNNGHESSDGATGHKATKTKNWRLEKLSWNEIRRPAGAMQNYIAQRQVELAGAKTPPSPLVQPPVTANVEPEEAKVDHPEVLNGFKELSTLQMMDDLSRDLVHWQQMVTQQNEK